MSVILYTTGCPKCKILQKKLDSKGIQFDISEDVDFMIEKGFTSAPVLEVDGEFLQFKEANDWINGQE